jgi:methionyl aminopeptidase
MEEYTKEDLENLKLAGEICKKIKSQLNKIVLPGKKLLDIAEEIESKIIELGAKPAFPTNLSINEVAAHSTPSWNSEEIASGLLKVDFGVHISGIVADNAVSFDLDDSKKNKSLIESSQLALDEAIKTAKPNTKLSEIGSKVDSTAESKKTLPIRNLSGHSISPWELHSGTTIPNFDNSSSQLLSPGVYAIEPFVTLSSGSGLVKDGKPSGIYHLKHTSNVRDAFARKVLEFIEEEYQTLPFCSRWIYKKFGSRGLLALRQIENSGCLHHYNQLIESSKSPVAQSEHTILITDKVEIIT